ncbi:MAG TPA: FtsX-like permease family protein [Puia sp.]|nr:FtsX-like permease family protein [Puia sp.]
MYGVDDEWHVDRWHEKDSRLFQVLKNASSPTGISTDERTPGLLAATLIKEIPEVEYASAVVPLSWFDKKGLLTYGDRRIDASAEFAGADYFSMFSYQLIEGDKDHVLQDNASIVISDKMALKLFNTTAGVVGKSIEWDQKDYNGVYRITGIFATPPANATEQFDIVFNYALFLEKNAKLNDWNNNDPSTFVVLKKGADVEAFNRKIVGLIKARVEGSTTVLWAQRYSDRYLYNHYENGAPDGGRIEYVRMFSLIAVFILVMACINFMNFSTAKAAGRIKETGVKKVIGASRAMLIFQYMGESLILSFLGLLIAMGLVLLLLPQFNRITGKQLSLHFTTGSILVLLGMTVVTGVLSGSYPAIYLSRHRPAVILRNNIKNSLSGILVRKGLVVFQFTLSAIFILSVLVIYRQMRLIQTKNLGYNREHVIYFERGGPVSDNKEDYAPGGKYESGLQDFLQRIKATPGVVNATNFRHNITNRDGGTYDISWPGKDPRKRIDFTDLDAGYDFIETAGVTVKEGRTYSRTYGNERANIIFNETAIRTMGLKDPIGKVIRLWGSDRTIIGVVKDFNFQSLHENIKPCFFDLTVGNRASKIMVRIQGGREAETVARLESLYKAYNQGETFEYRWLDEDYQALYSAETRVADLSKYFAGIAIIISCLGLLGLASFTAQRRQREIGIRKVVGASVRSIVLLLSGDFLMLTGIALVIGFPVSWWMMTRWLHGFAYRIDVGAGVFFLTGGFVIVMTFLSIGLQSVRAALGNPAKTLRSE